MDNTSENMDKRLQDALGKLVDGPKVSFKVLRNMILFYYCFNSIIQEIYSELPSQMFISGMLNDIVRKRLKEDMPALTLFDNKSPLNFEKFKIDGSLEKDTINFMADNGFITLNERWEIGRFNKETKKFEITVRIATITEKGLNYAMGSIEETSLWIRKIQRAIECFKEVLQSIK